jgi:hypothetical protein
MKLLMENWRKFINEQEEQAPAPAFKFAMNGDANAPTDVPLVQGGQADLGAAVQSAMAAAADRLGYGPEGAKQAFDACMAIIGGEQALKANFATLKQRMVKGPANDLEETPPRGDMPVLDPKQFENFVKNLSAGKLDTLEDYADSAPLGEGVLDMPDFPDDMHTASDQEKAYFLQKGLKDKGGANDEDREVSFKQNQEIPVGSCYPTQQQIYVDKAIFNMLNFGAIKPGSTAFGSQVISVSAGGDYYILDGHHRWASAMLGSPTNKIKSAIISGMGTLKRALALLRAYGGAIGNAPRA